MCNTLHAEGFWGGHTGPFFHREKFGFSFWDPDPSDNKNNAILRAKWTGRLMENVYCNPAEDDCDPNSTGPSDSEDPSSSPSSASAATPAPSHLKVLVSLLLVSIYVLHREVLL